MLRTLEIENLKGIAERQRVDFAPLTLLFGANSAGKSTVLQALLYLHELIERGSAETDGSELGGNIVEFGGFARLVHRHTTYRPIVVKVEFDTSGSLERFGRDLSDFPFPDLEDEVESAWLELTIRIRRTAAHRGAVVDRAVLGVNGVSEPLVWLELGTTLREGEPIRARVNLRHPLLQAVLHPDIARTGADGAETIDQIGRLWSSIAVPEEVLQRDLRAESDGGAWGTSSDGVFRPQAGPPPRFEDGRSLPVFAVARGRMSALPAPSEPLRVVPVGDDTPETNTATQQVRTFLEMIVLGTTAQLAAFLRDSPYVGPLRTIPPRGYLYERPGRAASWADGLAAWDLLLADRLTLVERTNTWLGRLQAGCQVVVQELGDGNASAEERAEGHVDVTVRRLLLDTGAGSFVLPSEVGAGISQLIPVVVATIEGRGGLVLVEQPEVHVHPAVQVGLGDLLVEGFGGRRRVAVVETHSEHLLLRVMRRMRQTAEGTLPEGVTGIGPADVSIIFVEKEDGRTITRRMPLNEKGELVKAWPGGFFEEGLREVL